MPVLPPDAPGATLPATTPQAFATYLNQHFQGDDGKNGGAVAALDGVGATGTTLGSQWLTWHQAQVAKDGPGANSLLQYEEAFVVLWEEAKLGTNLAAGLGGGGAAVGALATSAATTATTLGSIFSVFQDASLWLRIGEGLLGIVLIAVGVAKLTGAVPAATKIAAAVK